MSATETPTAEQWLAQQIEADRAYVATRSLTELRKQWAINRRETIQAFRHTDFWSIDGLHTYRDKVLVPEFERRGYICFDPMILDQPRKANA